MPFTLFIANASAQETATVSTTGASPEVPYELTQEKMLMDTLSFLALMFAVFYFLLIRPQQKRLKSHKAMLDALSKGDKIVTGGGIIGIIHKFEGDDIAIIEIAPETRIKVTRDTITGRYQPTTPAASGKTANDN